MRTPATFFTFFPQFTPDPLNDRAWYPGFTDWDLIRNLPEADMARFRPARPFYDTADPAYMQSLLDQTKTLLPGGAGLMVYHYNFDGVPVLGGFERNLLAAAETPPFFICWANETWSKRWIGKPGEIIVEQRHLPDQGLIGTHAAHLAQLFARPEYLRVEGRPLWMIYNPLASPTLERCIALYRQAFLALGVDPLIGCCLPHVVDPNLLGPYDLVAEFQPRFFFGSRTSDSLVRLAARLKASSPRLVEIIGGFRDRFSARTGGRTYQFADYLQSLADGSMEALLRETAGTKPLMRATFLGWDNLPRYGDRATAVRHDGVAPTDLAPIAALSSDAGLPLLANSWNEWSEGAALEPAEVPHPLRQAFLSTLPTALSEARQSPAATGCQALSKTP